MQPQKPQRPNRLLPVTKPSCRATCLSTNWLSALTKDASLGDASFCTPVVPNMTVYVLCSSELLAPTPC